MNDIFHTIPTACVLCEYAGETHEEFLEHMNSAHDL